MRRKHSIEILSRTRSLESREKNSTPLGTTWSHVSTRAEQLQNATELIGSRDTAIVIKLTKGELQELGEPSIGFVDGSGYVAEMAVFYELHCI